MSLPISVMAGPSQPESNNEPLNLLSAPLSPVYLLFGIEPAAVERPGNMTDIAISILNNTDNLSNMPKDMAIEFAPYWILAGSHITYKDFASDCAGSNLLQTTTVSIAATSRSETLTDTQSTSLGFGLRFSILQGKIDQEFGGYADSLTKVYRYMDALLDDFDSVSNSRYDSDGVMINLNKRIKSAREASNYSLVDSLDDTLNQRMAEIKGELDNDRNNRMPVEIRRIREIIPAIMIRRVGWKLDFAAAVVVDFPGRQVSNGKLSRWGMWFTGGYDAGQLSALAVIRYIANTNNSDVTGFDLGGRLIYDNHQKFAISAEGIYRKLRHNFGDSDRWRLAMVTDYAVAKNMIVSFTFGRDFEGNRSGNLLSMVNLILGFGSDRPVTNR
jgi:hypothetical protein